MKVNDDELSSEEEIEDDIKDPGFILQNLEIATTDAFDDDTCMNAARVALANIVAQQISFYVSCVLNGFNNKRVPAAPTILIYGGGFIGKRVIEMLVDNKCGPMLYIFSRGDLKAKYYRSMGLRASPSMTRLMKGQKADVLIIMSGMSSFGTMSKHIMPVISRSTCLISSVLGLERKRFFAIFRTPGVFRTYVEAQSLTKQVQENEELQVSLTLNFSTILLTSCVMWVGA